MRYLDFRAATLSLLLPFFLLACGAREGAKPGISKRGAIAYKVRGTVRSLALPLQNPPMLAIEHEAIPGYVDVFGEISTMPSMTMEFPYARSLSLTGIEVGDAIEFTFVVDDSRVPPFEITALRELAP